MALTVPPDRQFSGSLDAAALQALVGRLGVQGTVDTTAHSCGTSTSTGRRLVVVMRDASNQLIFVWMGIDSEGVVR